MNYQTKKYQYKYGENTNGIEIKYDKRREETGNWYIETHEKTDPNNLEFILSGINKSNAYWYLIGDHKKILIFSIKFLRYIEEKFHHVTTETSKGFLIPDIEADKYADRIIILNQSQIDKWM